MLSGAAFAAPEVLHVPVVENTAATEAHAEHTAGGPPQFAIETFPSQLFWLAVSFGTLYLLMSGAALPRIRQGLEARSAHIHNLLADARRLRDEAEKHKDDMSSASDAAYQKAHDILNKAAAEAADTANRRNHELEAILHAKQKAAEDRIAVVRGNALQSVREAAQHLMPTIVQKLAGLQLSDRQIMSAIDGIDGNANGNHTRGAA